MFSAGRVLLMPKGAYDPSVTYEMLDLVSYNGSSYVAKSTTTGNLPTNKTYWQLSAYGGNAANASANFAEIETTSIATVAHPIDDIFVDENDQLMIATQQINVGDTIDNTVNCTATSVEQLLNRMYSYVDGLDSKCRKMYGVVEIATQTDLHGLAVGEYYKEKTTFYVTNAPTGVANVASAKFRLTIEAAMDNASSGTSPLLYTLRTTDGKTYTQAFDGSTWSAWKELNDNADASVFTGATSSANGVKGLVPQPLIANRKNFLRGDGTWTDINPPLLGGGYATCDTAEATVAKVAVLGGYALVFGGIVSVKFTYAVPANATLNINSTGAKPIHVNSSNITAGIIKAGALATFVYSGSAYRLVAVDTCTVDILEGGVTKVTTPSFSSLPQTFSAAGITADYELVQDGFALLSTPSAQGSEWTVTTGAGTITIAGTFIGSTATTVTMSLTIPRKTISAT